MIIVESLISKLIIRNKNSLSDEIKKKLDPTIHLIFKKLVNKFSIIEDNCFKINGSKLYDHLLNNFKNPELINSPFKFEQEIDLQKINQQNIGTFEICRRNDYYLMDTNYDELDLIKAMIVNYFPTFDYRSAEIIPAKNYTMHYSLVPELSIHRLQIGLEYEELVNVVSDCNKVNLDRHFTVENISIIPEKNLVRNYISEYIINEMKKCDHDNHTLIEEFLNSIK